MDVVSIPSPSCHASASQHHQTSEQSSIAFVRCLYQAKGIVRELEHLRSSALFDSRSVTPGMIESVQTYLDTTFNKFARLCKVLLAVLDRLEAQSLINRERLESFKSDINAEWNHASSIRLYMVTLLQQAQQQIPSPSFSDSSSTSSLTADPGSSTTASY
ncbi:hypothetical protein BJV82DRAFT_664830 [Fennellomyces sp. T-0311]|nr:hypothetical protein BJV82DRAFT_664830 [Fennellomyces sp. T-0311]